MAILINQFDQTHPITGSTQGMSVTIQNWFIQNAGGLRPVGVPVATVSAALIAQGWPGPAAVVAAAGGGPAAVVAAAGGGPAAVVAAAGVGPAAVVAPAAVIPAAVGVPAAAVVAPVSSNFAVPRPMSMLFSALILVLKLICALILAVAAYTLCQIISDVPEKEPDYKTMTVSERLWYVVEPIENEDGFYWLVVWPKIALARYMGVFALSWAFVPRFLYLAPSMFRSHALWEISHWFEILLLCPCANWIHEESSQLKIAGMYFVKFLIGAVLCKQVTFGALWEVLFYYLFVFFSTNKLVKAMYKYFRLFFQSFDDLKNAREFLGSRPIVRDDGTIDTDPDHPLQKLTYLRQPMNEYWELLGKDARSGSVTQNEKEELWHAHKDSFFRENVYHALQFLAHLRGYVPL
jgi:hypothetical protein